MIARKRARPVTDETRTYADSVKLHRRELQRGDEITIDGIRGRCAFVAYIEHVSGVDWIDVKTSRGYMRTVRPSRVKTVHATPKTGVAAP